MAANSVVGDQVWLKIKLILAFIVVLVIGKYEEDPFKNEGARMVTTYLTLLVYADFSRLSMAINSRV